MSWEPVDRVNNPGSVNLVGQPVAYGHGDRVEVLASAGGGTTHWTLDGSPTSLTRTSQEWRSTRTPAMVLKPADPRMFMLFTETDLLMLTEFQPTSTGWTPGRTQSFPAAQAPASAPQAVWYGDVIDVFYTTPTADGLASPVHITVDTRTLEFTRDLDFANADQRPARFDRYALIRPVIIHARPDSTRPARSRAVRASRSSPFNPNAVVSTIAAFCEPAERT